MRSWLGLDEQVSSIPVPSALKLASRPSHWTAASLERHTISIDPRHEPCRIRCELPPGSGCGDVVVTTSSSGTGTSTVTFTYAEPIVTQRRPAGRLEEVKDWPSDEEDEDVDPIKRDAMAAINADPLDLRKKNPLTGEAEGPSATSPETMAELARLHPGTPATIVPSFLVRVMARVMGRRDHVEED